MAKNRASGKRKGLDDYGQPIDLKKDAAKSLEQARMTAGRVQDEFNRIRNPTTADRFEYMSDIKRNLRNAQDIKLNKTTERTGYWPNSRRDKISQPIPMGKAPDVLSGRTVESGTRSLLQGLKGWIRGGGGSRLTGR